MADELEACRPDIGTGQEQKLEMFLAPRYSYKTSMLLAFMVYCFLYFRELGIDISIDYVRGTIDLAEDVLFELTDGLATKPFILELWGDLTKAAHLNSAQRINLSGKRDHTVAVSGLDKGIAGKHPDLVILDDMVNDKNYESIKAKRAGWAKLQHYYPVLPPWGSVIVSGTRFAKNDVYGRILNVIESDAKRNREILEEAALLTGKAATKKYAEAAQFKAQWRVYIRAVQNAKGDYYFPAVLNETFLAGQKRKLEPRLYASFYLMQPLAEGEFRFLLEHLHYFSARYARYPLPLLEIIDDHQGLTLKEFPVRVTMTIDPTVTANQTSDWTGISVVATDVDGNWWVLLVRRYLEMPSQIGEIAVDIIRRYVPAVVMIESANADVDMVKRIQRAISEENLPVSIQSYHPLRDEQFVGGRRRKAARIQALEPAFRKGKIYLHRQTCEALYEQYRDWPEVEHDDAIDSLAMHYGLAKPCAYGSLEEFENAYREEEDDAEPGDWVNNFGLDLYDRHGRPVRISVPLRGDGEGGRLASRAGMGSQRLRAG